MDARGGGDRGLALLRQLAQGCERCLLSHTRSRVVFGDGPAAAALLVLGEAPGEDEDARGVPFVGSAGRALDRLLNEAGVDRAALYVANVVMCRPPALPSKANRTPTPEEVEARAPYLDL